mgnify:CR=1 FL=1
MKLLEEDKLGGCPIDSVKLSDAKEWAIRMKEKGISYNTKPCPKQNNKLVIILLINFVILSKGQKTFFLRYTFCTNMANAGMNPKALQYIMGHSNITMTLNYYAHATFDSAKAEMLRIAA